jgi:hypothetical protein
MKNDLTQTRIKERYFLKMATPTDSGMVRQIKNFLNGLGKSEKKPPFFADAISNGILDFFKEMGYDSNR